MGVGESEADVVGECAEVGGVVVEAFEFDEQRAQSVDRLGDGDGEGVFDGEAVREGVGGGGVAADPFGQVDGVGWRDAVGRVSRCRGG